MPNKNLTDNEIIKALECCSTYKGKCTDCPAFVKVDRSNCKQVLLGAIEIINRQKEEIERLLQKTQRPQDADPMDFCGVLCDYAEGLIKKAKSEARKEFAERLKLHSYIMSDESQTGIINRYSVVTVNQIYNLLKEMESDKND